MKTAAIVFGLMGGVAYLLAGIAVTAMGVPVGATWTTATLAASPWWIVMMIPIGVAGIIGGGWVRWNRNAGGILLWLASAGFIVVGMVSIRGVLAVIADSPLTVQGWQWIILLALASYFIGALLAMMLGGTLALVGGMRETQAKGSLSTAKAKSM